MNIYTSTPFQRRAVAAGVTKELLRDVIGTFYAKVRQDDILGPLFNSAIDDWDRHLEKVTLFWTTATRLTTGYKGRDFMPAHAKVAPIREEQIARWLSLFQETLAERCDSEASEVLLDIAKRMAESIEIGLSPRTAE